MLPPSVSVAPAARASVTVVASLSVMMTDTLDGVPAL